MVMHARKQPRLTDGCNERRDYQSYQTLKYQSKSHSANEHRHDKLQNSSDQTPPSKMLRRSDSPDGKRGEGDGRTPHTHRPKETSTSSSPHENSVNHGHHSANSHPLPPKCAEMRDPADDWSEHISSSGKKYYYNCRTEVSQWEKPKEWLEREQRQKEASKAVVVNSFPKDRDYRQEAMQAAAASAVTAIKSAPSEKPSSHCGFSQASCSASGGPNISSAPSSSTSSSPHSSALLQDPALLRQLLPALQATLHINNSSVDMAKINEVLTAAVTQASLQSMLHKLLTAGPSAFNITALLSQAAQLSTQAAQQPSQSPVSVTPDASSPKSCLVSPRVSTPQTNSMASKPLPSAASLPAQIKVSELVVKSALQHSSDKVSEVEDPRLQRQNSQGPPSSGPNGCLVNSSAPACPPTTFSPSLALHFNENLIRHVQSWPSDHVEKQAARLREDVHNMGSMNMSEICVELKKLRSLVRVCEIQATLREQRILFLRQEIKELEKLKNQNSFMV
ncbi:WW domain containing adaptor with coiled-coil b isoform 1-T1 [Clarias gariepinus]|uniref:WW domain containing adaptor with coiled-coil b isoform X1 n=1 Tax=Clarias gariepinus TaxID=13013 RepID=UPI00234C7B5A|nr:WW domain containing adaptor with coiled-coil b isoform X1 [Clarias gariepinus]